ncbi:tyrosine-type recombinase/integrase [Ornithinimicrobium sp. W1665]|uniref:tyrosine-type recombinase/integrase n=1 Tax=Ornithinimicrobium sp. W1665 TaxID=3416666 RepID=UPI003CEF257A
MGRRAGRAFIEDRWYREDRATGKKVPAKRHGVGRRWKARWIEEDGRERSQSYDRKVDAQRRLDEVTADVLTGRYVDARAGEVTFSAYMARWAALQVWKPRTTVGADLIRRSVPFGDVALRSLTKAHVEAWKKQMIADGYAPLTVNHRLVTVRSVLKAAVEDNVVPSNVAASVRPVRLDGRTKRVEIPPAQDVAAVIEASEPRMKAYVELAAYAGLRLGEISAVQVGDVDFLRRVLHVRRQVQARPGGPPEVREPKYESVRDVPIPDELVQTLARHVEDHGVSSQGWLFFTGAGRPMPPSSVNNWWGRTTRAAGVEGLHLHALRHFFASGLIAAGCDVVTVQRALGHSKPSTTLDTYSHLWPDAEDRTRAAAGSLARRVRESGGAAQVRPGGAVTTV